MISSQSQSDVDGSGVENSASTLSPNGHDVSSKAETAEEAQKRRAQRRRNRKKLVTSHERLKDQEPLRIEPKNGLNSGSELILKPPLEAQVKSLVTFKELEIRPISEGKIFVQKDHSFVPISQDVFFLSSTQNLLEVNPVSSSPESVALDYQKRFVPIATICHGLLAGMSLWQSIMVSYLEDYKSFKNDEGHQSTARAFQVLFYILATISTIAVLDWCIPNSISTWKGFRKHLALQPLSLFALLLGFSSVLTWALTAQLDDTRAAQFINGTSIAISLDNVTYLEDQWATLNLVRCTFAGLSFILTAVSQYHLQGENQHQNGSV